MIVIVIKSVGFVPELNDCVSPQQMADDPELQRLKQTSKIISNVEYHREVEKKQDMENRRRFVEGGLPNDSEKSQEDGGVALHQLNDVLAGINMLVKATAREI